MPWRGETTWRALPALPGALPKLRGLSSSAGVPIASLKPCDAAGADGTQLVGCAKVYLPPPAGPHGLVLRLRVNLMAGSHWRTRHSG